MKPIIPTALVILDGFGYAQKTENNAIYHAKTPHLEQWMAQYPHALLHASGTAVGLLGGCMGNSEVGHLTIGSGRITPQPATFIHTAIVNKSFFKNPTLVQCLQKISQLGTSLHIMGLLSDASVHSDIEDIYALLDAAHQYHIKYVFIHAFLDGRDTPPQSAAQYLEQLDNALTLFEYGSLASLHGRFYAMDRDNNWERTEKTYRVLAFGENNIAAPWEEILQDQYDQGLSDEFIIPTQLDPTSTIQEGDGIIFINFREDRARQLTAAFVDPQFSAFATKRLSLSCFITPIAYAPYLKTDVLFEQPPLQNTLKDVLAAHHKTIFSIAETEKYAHITYFFAGKREEEVPGETRVLVPSIVAQNYIHTPCMSAPEITALVCNSLEQDPHDFYLINYANADMVGHSGNFDATVKAIECLDIQLAILYDIIVRKMNGTLYITADHGKAECMYDTRSDQPETAHTINQVPFIMIHQNNDASYEVLPLKQLSDIAPFILKNMHLPVPNEMKKLLLLLFVCVSLSVIAAAEEDDARCLIEHEDLKPWVLDYDTLLIEKFGLSNDPELLDAAQALKRASFRTRSFAQRVGREDIAKKFHRAKQDKRRAIIQKNYNFNNVPSKQDRSGQLFESSLQSFHSAMQDPVLFVKNYKLLNHKAYMQKEFLENSFLLDIRGIVRRSNKAIPQEYVRYYVNNQLNGAQTRYAPFFLYTLKRKTAYMLLKNPAYTRLAQELMQDVLFNKGIKGKRPAIQKEKQSIIKDAPEECKEAWESFFAHIAQGFTLSDAEAQNRENEFELEDYKRITEK